MMKNVSKEQADRIFRSCDTSGDKKISLDEFRKCSRREKTSNQLPKLKTLQQANNTDQK